MGTLEEIIMLSRNSFDYEEHVSDGVGHLLIKGLVFPDRGGYDVLGKLWASTKKKIQEQYEVQSTGLFDYGEDGVECEFFLSFHDEKQSPRLYFKRFADSFPFQMDLFKEVLEAFMLDSENGYVPFCEAVKISKDIDRTEREEFFNELLNDFLISINMKKRKRRKHPRK